MAAWSALPFWQAPPVPVSETQPAVPGFWDSSPSAQATPAGNNRNAPNGGQRGSRPRMQWPSRGRSAQPHHDARGAMPEQGDDGGGLGHSTPASRRRERGGMGSDPYSYDDGARQVIALAPVGPVLANERPQVGSDRTEVLRRPLDREAGLGEPEALVADLNAQAVRAQLGLEAGPLRLDLRELVLDLEPGAPS